MRHGKKFNHLSRKKGHRRAMLSNMACSLIEHKRINTTVAKAKALRVYVEPLLTKSKTDSTHSRRTVFSYLQSKEAVTELFREVAPKIATRPGGYTRIIRTGNRLGDNAEMCLMELVDFNELMLNDSKEKKTTRRSRRGGKKGSTTAVSETKDVTAKTEKAETPKAEVKEEKAKAEEKTAKKETTSAPKAEKEAPKAETKAAKKEEAPKAEAKKEATKKTEAKKEETPKSEAKPDKETEEKKKASPKAEKPVDKKGEDKKTDDKNTEEK